MLSCDPSVVTQGPGQCEALGLECPSVAECCVNMGRMPSPAETQTPGKGTVSFLFSLLQGFLQGETCGHSSKPKGAVGFLTTLYELWDAG